MTAADMYSCRVLIVLAVAEAREGPRDLGQMRLRACAARLDSLGLAELAAEARALADSPKRWRLELQEWAERCRERLSKPSQLSRCENAAEAPIAPTPFEKEET